MKSAWHCSLGCSYSCWTDHLRNDTHWIVPAILWRQAVLRGHGGATRRPKPRLDDNDDDDDDDFSVNAIGEERRLTGGWSSNFDAVAQTVTYLTSVSKTPKACIFDSHIPGAMTSSSQIFMWSVMADCTMTYLKGGRLYGQYTETVAAAGTAPGYWPHSVYCHKVGAEMSGLTFVKPTMKLFCLYAIQSVHTNTNNRPM